MRCVMSRACLLLFDNCKVFVLEVLGGVVYVCVMGCLYLGIDDAKITFNIYGIFVCLR